MRPLREGIILRSPDLPGSFVSVVPSRLRLGSASRKDGVREQFERVASTYERDHPEAKRVAVSDWFSLGALDASGTTQAFSDGTRRTLAYTHAGRVVYQIFASLPRSEEQKAGAASMLRVLSGTEAEKG